MGWKMIIANCTLSKQITEENPKAEATFPFGFCPFPKDIGFRENRYPESKYCVVGIVATTNFSMGRISICIRMAKMTRGWELGRCDTGWHFHGCARE
ncbi:Oligopeptide transporter 3 [Senna tora]|uniref:Oligopeptide transporter 3 n=1 Tax=Senna tora TaxID=362788 RepID=A0A834WRP7_9FABA|nr:Oligopeptide transporter 3 [Senna tora]